MCITFTETKPSYLLFLKSTFKWTVFILFFTIMREAFCQYTIWNFYELQGLLYFLLVNVKSKNRSKAGDLKQYRCYGEEFGGCSTCSTVSMWHSNSTPKRNDTVVHNSLKEETTQMAINWQKRKCGLPIQWSNVGPDKGVRCWHNIDGAWKCYAKWKKLLTKDHMLLNSIFIKAHSRKTSTERKEINGSSGLVGGAVYGKVWDTDFFLKWWKCFQVDDGDGCTYLWM